MVSSCAKHLRLGKATNIPRLSLGLPSPSSRHDARIIAAESPVCPLQFDVALASLHTTRDYLRHPPGTRSMLSRIVRGLLCDVRSAAARRQFARFGVVGLAAAAAYYAILAGLVELTGMPVLVATSIAFVTVCIANYFSHRLWTFASSDAHASAFPRFVLMVAVGFCINWGVMLTGVSLLGLNYLLVQAAAIACVVTWNYLLSSYWVFRR